LKRHREDVDGKIRSVLHEDKRARAAKGFSLEDQVLVKLLSWEEAGWGLADPGWVTLEFPDAASLLLGLAAKGFVVLGKSHLGTGRTVSGWRLSGKGERRARAVLGSPGLPGGITKGQEILIGEGVGRVDEHPRAEAEARTEH